MSEVKDNYKNTAVYFIRNIRKGKRRRDVKAMTEKCLMCGKCIEVCPLGIESLNIKTTQRNKTYYKIKSDFEYLKSQQTTDNGQQDKALSSQQLNNSLLRRLYVASHSDHHTFDEEDFRDCERELRIPRRRRKHLLRTSNDAHWQG